MPLASVFWYHTSMIRVALFVSVLMLGMYGIAHNLFSVDIADVEAATASVPVLDASATLPALNVAAYYVFDTLTGTPLLAQNETASLPIASITKLIAGTIYFRDVDPLQVVTVTSADVAAEGEAGRLVAGDTYTARDMLFPALLESSNDASEIQQRLHPNDLLLSMHALANRADATDVTFADASGLSAQNAASAQSVGKLLMLIAREQPHVIDITRLSQFVHTNTTWINNSPLASLAGYGGGKHGYTHEAGRTAAALFTDVLADGTEREIGYVVLNSDDLRADVETLRRHVSTYTRLE